MANGRKPVESKKLDEAVDGFKKATIHPSAKTTPPFIDVISGRIEQKFKEFAEGVEEKLTQFNDAINIYSGITKDVEKRQIAVENKVKGSVETIKFFFGGGCLLTLINIIIAIIMVIVGKS